MQLLFVLILLPLAINVLYLFIFSVAASLRSSKACAHLNNATNPKFAVLIPAYKEDAVILDSVRSVMAQKYPVELMDCIVIADELQESSIQSIQAMGAEVVILTPNTSRNKANALQYFLTTDNRSFEACVILDADNVLNEDFLAGASAYLSEGHEVIQARRLAKNANSPMARLDGLSEILNNHIFRKGQRAMGLSASLIGSGMIFQYELFGKLMEGMKIFSGFDKELELRLLKQKTTIEYADDLIVLDEKVASKQVFVHQRRRWSYAQLYFLKRNAAVALSELVRRANLDYFNKVLQFALLPRIITIGLSGILLVISMPVGGWVLWFGVINFVALVFSLYLAWKKQIKAAELKTLIRVLPSAFMGMVQAIFTSGKAANKFLHTPHQS